VSVVANVAINVDSSGAVSKLRQVQTQAQSTQRAFGALQSAIAGLGVASIAAQTLKAAASFNDLQTRLKLLTSEYGEYTQAQQFAAKAAKQFGLSNREAATGVADIYGRLRPLGVSLKDIQSTFNGFNTIARLSGVSAEGASAAFLQLGQALGSGRLQGDEFRSIAEQVPGLLVAVSKETGIAAKDLKQFASDGKLSADIVINALKRIESEGAGKIAALVQNSDTQKFKDLQNAVDDLSVAVGNELLPVVTPLIKDLTSLVGTIAALPDPVKNATGETVKLIAQFLLLQKAIQITIGLQAALAALTIQSSKLSVATTAGSSAWALYANNAAALAPKVAGVSAVFGNLKLAMLAIPGAGWTAAAIIGLGLLSKAVYDTNRTFRNFVNNIGGVVASDFKSAVEGMADDARNSAANIQKAYEKLPPELSPIAKFIRELFQGAFKDTSNAAETSAAVSSNAFNDFFNGLVSQGAAGFNGLSAIINNWWSNLPAPIRNIFSGNAVSMLTGAAGAAGSAASRAPAPNAQATGIYGRYGAPLPKKAKSRKTPAANALNIPIGATVGGTTATGPTGGKPKAASDEAANAAKRVAEQIRASQVQLTLAQDIFAIEGRLQQAQLAGNDQLVLARNAQKELAQIASQRADIVANKEMPALEKKNVLNKLAIDAAIVSGKLGFDLAGLEQQRAKDHQAILQNARLEFALAKEKDPLKRAEMQIEDQLVSEQIKKLNLTEEQINQIRQLLFETEKLKNATVENNQLFTDMASATAGAFGSAIDSMIDGTESLGVSLRKIGADLLKTIAKMLIMQAIAEALGALGGTDGKGVFSFLAKAFGKNANGNAYGANGIIPFAKGGIVNSPTLFPFAKGIGLMGEAGPEAIMPLSRGPGGKLGVTASGGGGGGVNVVVNVDASGSKVEGDEQEGKQLGRLIAAAIQQELVKQKRPGGLLT
jgi:lambda family phage tail tape measure protein